MSGTADTLLTATARGDAEAFAELYARFSARMLGLIVRVLGGRRDAEDVLQEVFREVWCKADRFDPARGSEEGWLIMLARSRAIDHLRRRAAGPAVEPTPDTPPAASTSASEHNDLARRTREALSLLPEEQREAVGLAFYHGLTAAQVADHQGVPHGTAKTRIRLGMGKLRECLHPEHERLN